MLAKTKKMIRKINESMTRLLRNKAAIIIILVVVLAALVFSVFFFGEKASFKVEDKCGKFVNLFTHTIPDEGSCKTRCITQCSSMHHSYKSYEFVDNGNACNDCTCHCR